MGIEPTSLAWKAKVMTIIQHPLIFFIMVGKTGFEPATSWSQTRRYTKLSYFPISIIEQKMAHPRGLEPLTF